MKEGQFRQIVVLTGAGISAESGIQTFRDQGGLWESHRLEEVATPEAFHRDPALVQRFYNARRAQLPEVAPNAAHLALAQLEKAIAGTLLITQNIDDLHERAGSHHLLHMHGELAKARCVKSGQLFRVTEPLSEDSLCTCCVPAQPLRPHVVWFGEMPLGLDRIFHALAQCDLFVAIGTSGQVYPAAGFVDEARSQGAYCIEINADSSHISHRFDEHRRGSATVEVPKLVAELMGRGAS
ncbi:Sir2 family NAD-dependent protein deacetylase [Gallaecimonas xiamenensis 3-C-1]|uniref:NAD-dependent protein deacylase n=1 Tax=Gallaecimonas xiamenensis 3-C-1 TaxID=745411 RepID=K2JND7_9GAMM|nr:Sir2 family NAD+-dependent deacetylase [Gallaecimonas xiamenensis]EKE76778.1 Sir2 family NAD-dependent protein deacetylase [Gallaecimonas xiamenensis 3-C-1]